MIGPEHDPLLEIAEAVSDDTPVDWERAKAQSPPLVPVLEDLAVLERIRDAHRSPVEGSAESGTPLAASDAPTIEGGVTPPEAPPLKAWGTLRILEKVGEGAWGEVFRAFDPSLETEVALKLLKADLARNASALERFVAEGRRLARVRHPNVLVVHGADRHGDRVGIWSEFLRGESLEQHIRKNGPMSAREAALIGLDLCRALSAVHAAGLIHRDIKASNVMREEGGRIVLMDFGSVAEVPRGGSLDSTQHLYGTPTTMAPEQLRGETAGPTTDVYGLGCLLYHLVSGRYPVEARTLPDLVWCHEKGQYVSLRDRRPDLPLEFVQVVERAIAPAPGDRYSTASSMERALAGTLDRGSPSWQEWLASHWGVPVAATALLAVFVGLGAWQYLWHDGGRANRTALRPGPLSATVGLLRVVDGVEEPVLPGARVAPRDRLGMQVTADERMHVYVLNEDQEGNIYVLFPVPGVKPANPLEPHRTYRLPGTVADSLLTWDVTSAGGKESIITIGTRTPLQEIDSVLAKLPRAERGGAMPLGRLDPRMLPTLRGIGGMSTYRPEPKSEPGAHRWVEEMVQRLQARRAERGDVWIWKAELENPAPEG